MKRQTATTVTNPSFKKVEVNKTIFQSFGPSTSDEEGSWDDTETGAFPSLDSSKKKASHVFTDEPFNNSYSSLEIVEEGSKEEGSSMAGTSSASPHQAEEFISISATSSETPAVDNTAEARKKMALQQQYLAPPGIQQTISTSTSSSGGGYFPYNIYQALSKTNKEGKEDEDAEEHDEKSQIKTTVKKMNQGRPSNTLPQVTPMSLEEEQSTSGMTDKSQIVETSSLHAPNSVVSTRSRRHGKRYVVRHMLTPSQQVNANPAIMLKNLFIGIEQERHMHQLAAQNLRAVNDWLLFLPSILLALLSGVVSLVFQADLNNRNDEVIKVYSAISVGVTALISVFWQALSKQLDLGTRSAIHDATAGALKRLSEDIMLTLSSTEIIPAEYVTLISEKFGQALDSCSSNVPYKLEAAFSNVSDRMVLMLQPPTGQLPRKHVHKLDFMRLYATAYDELASEIIMHWAWPFAFPQPRSVSERALRSFKAIITEGREVPKKGCLRLFGPCLGYTKTVERSLFDVVPPVSVSDSTAPPYYSNDQNNSYHIRSHMVRSEV